MPKLLDPKLDKILGKEREYLELSNVPIVTVSAQYLEDLKGLHSYKELDNTIDVVYSRAHYSMALATAIKAWGKTINPKKAWLTDPTNFIVKDDLFKIKLTETVGKTLARNPFLKKIKDVIDKFGRNQLPILSSIETPLYLLTQNIKKPIISFHIAAGNILVKYKKKVLQVITDPHVRYDYLENADSPLMFFSVFDEETKEELLEKALVAGKKINPKKIFITGPPVDPRIIKASKKKNAWHVGPIKLCLTTGGLGTNKKEIAQVLNQLLPTLKQKPSPFKIMLYAGTHLDIKDLGIAKAKKEQINYELISGVDPADFTIGGTIANKFSSLNASSNFFIVYHPQIVDANELLVRYAFPFADGFISKPSGDMAYDAAISGSFLLTLQEWGEWELNIKEIFERKKIAQEANLKNIVQQLFDLAMNNQGESWINRAMCQAANLETLYKNGCENILTAAKKLQKII